VVSLVGLDDLGGLFQAWWFCDSNRQHCYVIFNFQLRKLFYYQPPEFWCYVRRHSSSAYTRPEQIAINASLIFACRLLLCQAWLCSTLSWADVLLKLVFPRLCMAPLVPNMLWAQSRLTVLKMHLCAAESSKFIPWCPRCVPGAATAVGTLVQVWFAQKVGKEVCCVTSHLSEQLTHRSGLLLEWGAGPNYHRDLPLLQQMQRKGGDVRNVRDQVLWWLPSLLPWAKCQMWLSNTKMSFCTYFLTPTNLSSQDWESQPQCIQNHGWGERTHLLGSYECWLPREQAEL